MMSDSHRHRQRHNKSSNHTHNKNANTYADPMANSSFGASNNTNNDNYRHGHTYQNSGKVYLYGQMILGIVCLAAMSMLVGSYSKFTTAREYQSYLKAEQQQHDLDLQQQHQHHQKWADTVQDQDMVSAPEGLNWDHDQSLDPRHYSHFGAAVPLSESSVQYKDTPLQDRTGSGKTYYGNGNTIHERAGTKSHAGHTTDNHAGHTNTNTDTDTDTLHDRETSELCDVAIPKYQDSNANVNVNANANVNVNVNVNADANANANADVNANVDPNSDSDLAQMMQMMNPQNINAGCFEKEPL
jgi:hypothetical protein